MFNLQGKKALVTGATGGLGRGILEALVAQGAVVAITGTRQGMLEQMAETMGAGCHAMVCNLSDKSQMETLIPRVEEKLGGLDILVNNAGLTKDNLMLRMKDADFEQVLQVNLHAPFVLMRAALKGMVKQRYGRMINITSVVGTTGNPGQANYCASKAGLAGLSKALAKEVASRGITVNCIAPGFMSSAMTDILTDEQKKIILSSIPMGMMGTARDIGAAVVFLASAEASYITGQTLHINGGMTMV